ncbi:MAG: hypothetical protein BEN19_07580 [Epulopiscium sp. Nuni2H_MBin003]|nr:MAG: hypothetical protein BEN19_07580 [Epulopiscium sp. Nuni2H_MBin003]
MILINRESGEEILFSYSLWNNISNLKIEEFTELINNNVNLLNFRTYRGEHLLNLFCKKGNLEIVKYLIDTNKLFDEITLLKSCLEMAILHAQVDIIKYLYKYFDKCENDFLRIAINGATTDLNKEHLYLEILKYLMEKCDEDFYSNYCELNLLYSYSVEQNCLDIAKFIDTLRRTSYVPLYDEVFDLLKTELEQFGIDTIKNLYTIVLKLECSELFGIRLCVGKNDDYKYLLDNVLKQSNFTNNILTTDMNKITDIIDKYSLWELLIINEQDGEELKFFMGSNELKQIMGSIIHDRYELEVADCGEEDIYLKSLLDNKFLVRRKLPVDEIKFLEDMAIYCANRLNEYLNEIVPENNCIVTVYGDNSVAIYDLSIISQTVDEKYLYIFEILEATG